MTGKSNDEEKSIASFDSGRRQISHSQIPGGNRDMRPLQQGVNSGREVLDLYFNHHGDEICEYARLGYDWSRNLLTSDLKVWKNVLGAICSRRFPIRYPRRVETAGRIASQNVIGICEKAGHKI
jgi:hypothetical protein